MAEYLRPATLNSALDALDGTPWSVLAGGTDFSPARVGRALDEDVLDISALRELRSIEALPDHWRFGALITWSDIIRADLPPMFDGLKLAAREVGRANSEYGHAWWQSMQCLPGSRRCAAAFEPWRLGRIVVSKGRANDGA